MRYKCPACGCRMVVATLSDRPFIQEPSVKRIKAKRAKADAARIAKGIDPIKARLKKRGIK